MPTTRIVNGTALLGEDLRATPDAVIDIADGRIVAVGSGPAPADGATVVDAGGGYVVPGLIDWHVHLDLDHRRQPLEGWEQPPDVRAATIAHNGLRALRAGITTVRDLGAADHSVLRFCEVHPPGPQRPRIVACGEMIAMPGGHAHEVARVATGPDDVRRAVHEQLSAGAGVIKVMASGGFSTPGDPLQPEFSLDELRAAVDEAARTGVEVAAHAHPDAGVALAVEAGVATVEHGGLITRRGAEILGAADVALVPTIRALTAPVAASEAIPALAERYRGALDGYRASIGSAVDAGARVLAGTDGGTYLNDVGGLVDELEEYAALGMSGLDVLRSCTTAGGRAADGMPVGRIDVGAAGDVVIVDGDPRDDPGLLRRPRAVVVAGRLVDLDWIERTLAAERSSAQGRV